MALPTIYNIELCAGSGMLAEGIKIALDGRMRTIAYVEHEPYAAALLAKRIEEKSLDEAPIWDDVHTCASKAFVEQVAGFRPMLLTGGYPCQPFSVAGKRLGEDDPRHLWPSIDKLIGILEPEYVFFENVGGHLRLGFNTVQRTLTARGYQVTAGLFTAAEVGASHRRERLFILGIKGMANTGNSDGGCGELVGDNTPINVADAGAVLADCCCAGQQGCCVTGYDVEERWEISGRQSSECGLQLFAPGPKNIERWREILTTNPHLEPAICRTSNGVAGKLDKHRLRIIGNGVVPLAVAYAFISLLSVAISE